MPSIMPELEVVKVSGFENHGINEGLLINDPGRVSLMDIWHLEIEHAISDKTRSLVCVKFPGDENFRLIGNGDLVDLLEPVDAED